MRDGQPFESFEYEYDDKNNYLFQIPHHLNTIESFSKNNIIKISKYEWYEVPTNCTPCVGEENRDELGRGRTCHGEECFLLEHYVQRSDEADCRDR